MHSFTASDGTVFNYNSEFVAEHIRSQQITKLEQKTFSEIIGF